MLHLKTWSCADALIHLAACIQRHVSHPPTLPHATQRFPALACLPHIGAQRHIHTNAHPQARDDPIAPYEGIPFEALEANPNCILVVTPTGGHLGWCSGPDVGWLLSQALLDASGGGCCCISSHTIHPAIYFYEPPQLPTLSTHTWSHTCTHNTHAAGHTRGALDRRTGAAVLHSCTGAYDSACIGT
jgi:hypothetical protein